MDYCCNRWWADTRTWRPSAENSVVSSFPNQRNLRRSLCCIRETRNQIPNCFWLVAVSSVQFWRSLDKDSLLMWFIGHTHHFSIMESIKYWKGMRHDLLSFLSSTAGWLFYLFLPSWLGRCVIARGTSTLSLQFAVVTRLLFLVVVFWSAARCTE